MSGTDLEWVEVEEPIVAKAVFITEENEDELERISGLQCLGWGRWLIADPLGYYTVSDDSFRKYKPRLGFRSQPGWAIVGPEGKVYAGLSDEKPPDGLADSRLVYRYGRFIEEPEP